MEDLTKLEAWQTPVLSSLLGTCALYKSGVGVDDNPHTSGGAE